MFANITKLANENEESEEAKEEEKEITDSPKEEEQVVEDDYRGYQDFQVWCQSWRNIQHRLRYLTFLVCKYLDECTPSVIEIRIPNKDDRLPHYGIESFVFLNGYMRNTHLANVSPKDMDVVECNALAKSHKGRAKDKGVPIWKLEQMDEDEKLKENGGKAQIRVRDPFMTRQLDGMSSLIFIVLICVMTDFVCFDGHS